MSLTTVTLALDDKLRSLRNSSFDSDKDIDLDVIGISNHNNNNNNTNHANIVSAQPLSIGENIPFADESPERPLIQPRSKPVRVSTYNIPSATRYPTRLYSSHGGSTSPNSPPENLSSSPQSHSSQENVVVVVKTNNTVNTNSSNSNNNNNNSSSNNKGGSVSSDDTDVSTTSNPMEKYPTATVRIDRDMIREMNRILTTLERKATKLNRSFSLNYKSHKADCCCLISNNNMSGGMIGGGSVTIGSNNNNNNYRVSQQQQNQQQQQHPSSSIRLSSGTITLTKDEKTDKNTNKKRQIQDGKSRRYTNRSIKRRHTVGGTHDYDVTKTGQRGRCQQGHDTTQQIAVDGGNNVIRTSSPELAKSTAETIICTAACEISVK